MTTPVITALVCSARRRGNAYELADYCLTKLREGPHRRTRLLSFHEYDVQACQRCGYECFEDPPGCPVKDDAAWLWEYTWRSDAVIWAVPTYGGTPPATWLAFMQRLQYLRRMAPERRIPLAVICIADSAAAGAGECTPELLRRQAGDRWWNLIDFAVVSPRALGGSAIVTDLTAVPDVRRQLDDLVAAISSNLG